MDAMLVVKSLMFGMVLSLAVALLFSKFIVEPLSDLKKYLETWLLRAYKQSCRKGERRRLLINRFLKVCVALLPMAYSISFGFTLWWLSRSYLFFHTQQQNYYIAIAAISGILLVFGLLHFSRKWVIPVLKFEAAAYKRLYGTMGTHEIKEDLAEAFAEQSGKKSGEAALN